MEDVSVMRTSKSTSTIRKRKANNTAVQFEDDPGLSVPLNFDLSVVPELVPLDWFIEKLIAQHERDRDTIRPTSFKKLKEALNLILANLLNAYTMSPQCFVRVSRSPNSYVSKGNRYQQRPISFVCLQKVINYMADHNPPLIAFVNGFKDDRTAHDELNSQKKRPSIGKLSRIKATGDLLAIVVKHLEICTNGRIADDASLSNLPPITTKIILPGEMIVSSSTSEIIQLRAAKGKKDRKTKLMKYKDSDETKRMQSNLVKWNAFVQQHWLDLFLPDDELERLYRSHVRGSGDDKFFFKKKTRPTFVDLSLVRLYRVFNNGTFDQGGRFYGGWWQEIPKEYRKNITINGNHTREVDYSTIHPAMLYARVGLPLPDDAYSIAGLEEYRDTLTKPTLLALINAKKNVKAPDRLPEGWTWQQLQEAIINKNEPIREYLNSDIGLKLQRKDADIAEDVMLQMMDSGHLVLPIHDSFLVSAGETETLTEAMKSVYRKHTGGDIELKIKLSFIDELEIPTENGEPPDLKEIISLLESDSDYSRYRKRWSEFERRQVRESSLPVVIAPSLVPDRTKQSYRDITVTPVLDRPGYFQASYDGKPLVKSEHPFLDGARKLLALGADPGEELRMYHEGKSNIALRGKIGEAAKLTVGEAAKSGPHFRRWKRFGSPDGVLRIRGKSVVPERGTG